MISPQDRFRQQMGSQIEEARRRSQVGDQQRTNNEPGPFSDDIPSTPGNGGVGQFKFNTTEIDNINSLINALASVVAPASDDPSRSQAKASKQSIFKAQEHLQAVIDYGIGYIEKLQNAKERYEGVDADNADALH